MLDDNKNIIKMTERINPKREFFRVSPEEIKTFFDLIDGDLWIETLNEEDEDIDSICKNVREETAKSNISLKKGSRDMTKCFTDGQYIRHTIGINKTWIGKYDSSKNGIICDTKFYKSLSGFAGMHYSIDRTDRSNSANGWKECECEVNGKWISTYNL